MQRELTLLTRLDRQSTWWVVAVLSGTAGVVAALDSLIVPEVSLVLLYGPLVLLAAWRTGLPLGLSLSVLAGLSDYVSAAVVRGAPIPAAAASGLSWCAVFSVLAWMAAVGRRLVECAARPGRLDALTGLPNRIGLFERAEAELNRSRRTGRPLTVAFIDCDDFKPINDTMGHLAGDELLQTIAATLRSCTRSYDITARLGGDEFLVVLPETSLEEARPVIERLRDTILKAVREKTPSVTLSIGVAAFAEPPSSVDELIHAADEQMYVVKRAGKDGIRFAALGAASLAE